ncbi:MAG: hypothetical protein R3Y18_03680 [Bacillota bacterium]
MGVLSSITDWVNSLSDKTITANTTGVSYSSGGTTTETVPYTASDQADYYSNVYSSGSTATDSATTATTVTPTTTVTPSVSSGSTSGTSSSSSGATTASTDYYAELQAAIQAAYDNGAAVAQTNLNNQLSYADSAYAQATNPYGVAAENLQALGLSTDGGFSSMQQMANLSSKANLDASAYSDYNSVMAERASAKSVSEIEATLSSLEQEESSYWNEYYAAMNEETNAASTYSANLEEAMALVELNSNFDVYSYMIAKGVSETDAQNIATAAAAGAYNINEE